MTHPTRSVPLILKCAHIYWISTIGQNCNSFAANFLNILQSNFVSLMEESFVFRNYTFFIYFPSFAISFFFPSFYHFHNFRSFLSSMIFIFIPTIFPRCLSESECNNATGGSNSLTTILQSTTLTITLRRHPCWYVCVSCSFPFHRILIQICRLTLCTVDFLRKVVFLHLIVRFQFWRSRVCVESPFIIIIPWSSLTSSGSTC